MPAVTMTALGLFDLLSNDEVQMNILKGWRCQLEH